MSSRPFYLQGKPISAGNVLEVLDPYTQRPIGSCYQAGPAHLEEALASLESAQKQTETLPLYRRQAVLRAIASGIEARASDLAHTIVLEAGKPIQFASAEVSRAAATFNFAADYLGSVREELLPLDLAPGHEHRMGLIRRVPVGPVLGISPFNFPLNLVAHKVAPAIMAGCAFLMKPASATPLTALMLAEIVLEAGYPPAAVSFLPFPGRYGDQLVGDPRLALVSFTGSDAVGWPLKAKAGKKKVTLELGGDAAVLIAEDADLDHAARQCAVGAFAYAGQVCISIQRIVVVEGVYDAFRERFLEQVEALQVGDPHDPKTRSSALIDTQNYQRVEAWLEEAVAAGATYARRGARIPEQTLIHPTVLENLPRSTTLAMHEAFAPVVELIRVPDILAGFHAVNASRYGLQAAIFTHREDYLRQAWQQLAVGAVIANASPTLRVDAMPYGGVKDSGFGREGTRYAYEEYTEPRMLLW